MLSIDGRSADTAERGPLVATVGVGPRYFDTLRLPLLRGRAFTAGDAAQGREGAIVNRRFAETYLGAETLGQRIGLAAPRSAAPPRWFTIVGISPDVRQIPQEGPVPLVYTPHRADAEQEATLLVDARSEARLVVSRLREAIAALDPDVPLFDIRPLDAVRLDPLAVLRSE